MRCFTVIALAAFAGVQARPQDFSTTTQSPEASFLGLPASADAAIERTINIKFSCAGRRLGYYADINNDCKVFHICNPQELPDGQKAVMQYSFFCPANTMFDQRALTCAPLPSPVPCHLAEKYYSVNDQIGVVGDLPEIQRGQAVVTTHAVNVPALTVPAGSLQTFPVAQQPIRNQVLAPVALVQAPVREATVVAAPVREHSTVQLQAPVLHLAPVAGNPHLVPTSDKVVRLG